MTEKRKIVGTVPEVCRWIQAEILRGRCTAPKSEADSAYNTATDRACRIAKLYEGGVGRFQIEQSQGDTDVLDPTD